MTEAETSVAEHFGLNLKRCRRRAELTQGELAERSSLTRQAIGLIEPGERRPFLESFVSLAAALAVEPAVLLDGIGGVPAQRRAPGSYLIEPAVPRFVRPIGSTTAGSLLPDRLGAFSVADADTFD